MPLLRRREPDTAKLAAAVAAELVKAGINFGPGAAASDATARMEALARQPRSVVDTGAGLARSPLDRGPFGPGNPILPAPLDPPDPDTGRHEPRRWQYDPAWNLQVVPQRLVSWDLLRSLADQCDVVRRCIEIRKADMCQLEWSITLDEAFIDAVVADQGGTRVQAAKTGRDLYRADIDAALALLERPDPVNGLSWSDWLMMLLEEHLVLDAVSIWPRRNRKGDTIGFEIIDGSTIKPLLDWRGSTPQAPLPAYQQILYGFPRGEYTETADPDGEFTADALVYRPRNRRTWTPYGFSPTEQCLPAADLWMHRQGWLRAEFTDGTMPRTWMRSTVPLDPQQRRLWEAALNDELAGQTSERHRTKLLPEGFDPVESSEHDERYRADLDEWFAKQVGSKFGVMPTQLGIIPRTGIGGRGQQEGEKDQAESMSQRPTVEWLIDLLNDLFRTHCGMPRQLTFRANGGAATEDDAERVKMQAAETAAGLRTLNELRAENGEPAYDFPEADMPFLLTPTGPVFVAGSSAPKPSPVPFGAPPAPPAEGEDGADDTADGVDAGGEADEGRKFLAFAAKRRGGRWRDFTFATIGADTAAALNAAGAAGDLDAVKAVVATLPKAPEPPKAPRTPLRPFLDELTGHYQPLILATLQHLHSGTRQAVAVFHGRSAKAVNPDVLAELRSLIGTDPADFVALLRQAYADSYLAGTHAAAQQIGGGASVVGNYSGLDASIDWDTWTPGYAQAASEVADHGLSGLLTAAADTVSGIASTDLVSIAGLISDGLAAGDTIDAIADSIEGFLGDPTRAEMIAWTETNRAMSLAAMSTYRFNGVATKRWLVMEPCTECADNEAAGDIPLDQDFPDGASEPPAHPWCKCSIAPGSDSLSSDTEAS